MLSTPLSSAGRSLAARVCGVSVTVALAVASPPAQEHASLHPPDARLFLSVPDFPSVREAYGRTALGKLLRDERLSALATALGGGRENLGGVLLALYAEKVEAGEAPPVIDLCLRPLRAASLSVTLHGVDLAGLASEMSAGERAGEDPWALAAERLGVLVDLEFENAEAAAGALDLLLELVGAEARVATDDAAGRDPAPLAWRGVTAGEHVALFLGAVDEDAFARRVRGEEPGLAALDEIDQSRLAQSPQDRAQRDRARLDRRGVTVIEGFSTLAPDLSASPELARLSPLLYLAEGLIGPPAALLLRGGSWRVGLLEDGRFLTEGFHPLPSQNSPGAILGAGPLDEAALDLLHPDALIAWAARLETSTLVELFQSSLDPELAADLLGSLGSSLTASLLEPRSLVTAPPVQFAVALDDHEAFLRGVEILMGELEDRGVVSVKRGKYRKIPLYTLRSATILPGLPFDLANFLKPTLAVLEDRALVCALPTQTKREVRRILTRDPQQPVALERAELPQGVTELATADWMRYLGRIYTAVRALLPILPADELQEWIVDPESLPEAWSLTRHFQPSVRWKRVEEGGVHHHMESSFGPEVGLGLVFGAVWLFGFGEGLRENPSPGPDDPSSPESAQSQAAGITQTGLTELQIAVTLYRLDQGHLPESLQQLTLPTPDYPGGFLNGRPLAQDGWGNAYRYALEDETYRLWSTGADGIDQYGGGDDLGAD